MTTPKKKTPLGTEVDKGGFPLASIGLGAITYPLYDGSRESLAAFQRPVYAARSNHTAGIATGYPCAPALGCPFAPVGWLLLAGPRHSDGCFLGTGLPSASVPRLLPSPVWRGGSGFFTPPFASATANHVL